VPASSTGRFTPGERAPGRVTLPGHELRPLSRPASSTIPTALPWISTFLRKSIKSSIQFSSASCYILVLGLNTSALCCQSSTSTSILLLCKTNVHIHMKTAKPK
jgi:hypothetical protein